MLSEQAIEQRLVAVLKRRESDVALEVVALAPQVFHLERNLLLDRRDLRREQAAEPELLTLPLVEGNTLVQQRVREQVDATIGHGDRTAGPKGGEYVGARTLDPSG